MEEDEYGVLMSGGGFQIRNDHPEIERIFPLADWIKAERRANHKVYRRVVVVVVDWVEVKP